MKEGGGRRVKEGSCGFWDFNCGRREEKLIKLFETYRVPLKTDPIFIGIKLLWQKYESLTEVMYLIKTTSHANIFYIFKSKSRLYLYEK